MPTHTNWGILAAAVVISGLLPAGSALAQCEVDLLTLEEDRGFLSTSVAIKDDLACVGAPYATQGGLSGVYRRVGSRWVREATLDDPGAPPNRNNFGRGVAILGDVLIVGAGNSDTDSGIHSGAVYVFVRDATGWVEDRLLLPADAAPGAFFGSSVAADAGCLVVGARFADVNGAAYVFRPAGDDWIEEAKLSPSELVPDSGFGFATAINRDRILVGAYQEQGCGAAYVFRFDEGEGWVQEARLEASDAAEGDGFGCGVALDGEVAVVGALWSDAACPDDPDCNSGAAYVFRRSGGAWVEEARLSPEELQQGDMFGLSVAIQGDTVFVGTPGDDINGPSPWDGSGAVRMFRRLGDAWVEDGVLAPRDLEASDGLGRSVAVDGTTVFAGTWGSGSTTGAAYVFSLTDSCASLADFAAFQVCFSGDNGGVGVGCETLDAEPDGDVDLDDLTALLYTLVGP